MQQSDPVELLFRRASASGVTMAAICDRAGIARSTPSRWRADSNGATMRTLNALHNALNEIIAERSDKLNAVHAGDANGSDGDVSPDKDGDFIAAGSVAA